MRKPTKTSLKRRLDKKVSELVRARGKCERCGSRNCLQTAHIFSRRYLSVRWDLDNVLCLCASCHFWSHSNPILFTEFVRKKLGEDTYELLKEKHKYIFKFALNDLLQKLKVLESL
jgi:5-methylcytosine-specific restriction endonuclease McrA